MPFTFEEAKEWADEIIDFKKRAARGEIGSEQAADFTDRLLEGTDRDMEYSGEYCELESYVDSKHPDGQPSCDAASRMRAIAAQVKRVWSAEAVIGHYLSIIEEEARCGRRSTLLFNTYGEDGKFLGDLHEEKAKDLASCLQAQGFKAQAAKPEGSSHWRVDVSW